MSEDKCPECGNTSFISDAEAGEVVCPKCGLVMGDMPPDMGADWSIYDDRIKGTMRASFDLPPLIGQGMATTFRGDKDFSGRQLDGKTMLRMSRLRCYDNRSKMGETWRRNLSIAMNELDRVVTFLRLPMNVRREAANCYRKALKADLVRGRSIDAFVAASVYVACRTLGTPRPLSAIVDASTRELDEVSRTYRLMLRELGLRMPIDSPAKFVPSIAAKLSASRVVEGRAIGILREATGRKRLSGKEPRGLAAAALYMASLELKEHHTQRAVARASGTTEVTLRNRLRGLRQALSL